MRTKATFALLLCFVCGAFAQELPAWAAQAKPITNTFADTDLKQALADMAAQSGVSIVPDDTVQGTVSVKLKDVPLEKALDIVLSPGNYSWARLEGYYLVGKADPTSPNFLRFAKTTSVRTSYLTPERILSLLPQALAPYVKADKDNMYLTITASPSMTERIMNDVTLIDRPGQKIVLEALVTEVTEEVLNQHSFSWIWQKFGLSNNVDGSTFTYTQAAVSDVVQIKALIGKNLATVRANPRIMAIDGKEASVEVSKENYFEVVTGPATFAYTTLQTIKTGISLKMTPTIAGNGDITVILNPEVSDVVGQGKGGLPITTSRRASTTVRVRDGETIVIGGMTYANTRKRSNKIPILGDLPIIGQLFRANADEVIKTEVIIMITPHIVK